MVAKNRTDHKSRITNTPHPFKTTPYPDPKKFF